VLSKPIKNRPTGAYALRSDQYFLAVFIPHARISVDSQHGCARLGFRYRKVPEHTGQII